MGNPFVIFGFMVWFVATAAGWFIGIGATIAGASDSDGVTFGIGISFLLGACCQRRSFCQRLVEGIS